MAQKTKAVCYLEYSVVKIVIGLFLLLPYSLALKAGAGLGTVFFKILRKRREITEHNLSRFFSTKDSAEIRAMALFVYQHLGRTLAEFIFSLQWDREQLLSFVEVEGKQYIKEALRKGKGVILLSAHFGNWELVGQVLSALGFKLNVVARPLDNPLLDRLVNTIRSMFGTKIIANVNSVREIIKALRRNECVGILIDQNLYENAVFVDFLGKTAATTPIVPLLAQKTQAAIIPVHSVRLPDDRHRIVLEKELVLQEAKERDKFVRVNTRRCNEVVERWIKEVPDQWFWVHNRWKTRPAKVDYDDR